MVLADLFEMSFRVALHAAWRDVGGQPGEVDIVRAFFLRGLPALNRYIPLFLSPFGVTGRVGGVFCHQSPYVEQMSGPSVGNVSELADLLVVVRRQTNPPQQNALLLQAKMRGERPKGAQLALYADWPLITYRRGNRPLRPEDERQVEPPAPHDGAQFAFLSPFFDGFSDLSTSFESARADSLIPDKPLAIELARVLTMTSGRAFSPSPPGAIARGWDRLIWDLLIETARKASKTLRGGRRGSGLAMFLAKAHEDIPGVFAAVDDPEFRQIWEAAPLLPADPDEPLVGSDEPPPEQPGDATDDFDGFGVSVVAFDLEPTDESIWPRERPPWW